MRLYEIVEFTNVSPQDSFVIFESYLIILKKKILYQEFIEIHLPSLWLGENPQAKHTFGRYKIDLFLESEDKKMTFQYILVLLKKKFFVEDVTQRFTEILWKSPKLLLWEGMEVILLVTWLARSGFFWDPNPAVSRVNFFYLWSGLLQR